MHLWLLRVIIFFSLLLHLKKVFSDRFSELNPRICLPGKKIVQRISLFRDCISDTCDIKVIKCLRYRFSLYELVEFFVILRRRPVFDPSLYSISTILLKHSSGCLFVLFSSSLCIIFAIVLLSCFNQL